MKSRRALLSLAGEVRSEGGAMVRTDVLRIIAPAEIGGEIVDKIEAWRQRRKKFVEDSAREYRERNRTEDDAEFARRVRAVMGPVLDKILTDVIVPEISQIEDRLRRALAIEEPRPADDVIVDLAEYRRRLTRH
jgi:hypothetical protein